MRRRELIKRLKADRKELLSLSGGIFPTRKGSQERAERGLMLLHALENLLPEIIEKLEARP